MAKPSTPFWVTAAIALVILMAGMAVVWNKRKSGWFSLVFLLSLDGS